MNQPKQRSGCLIKIMKGAGLLIGCAAVLGLGLVIYQQAGLRKAYEQFPAPGRLVEVDGRRMHIHCQGSGSPTVVLDAGNGSYSWEWIPVLEQVSQSLRTCAYDRAGYGWSEPGPRPRHGAQVVEELHTLLEQAGENGPYVLVGHSLGGVHVRMYAFTYPDETAGLVLVDTAFPLAVSSELQAQMQSSIGFYRAMEWMAGSGILRVLGPLGGEGSLPETARKLPPELREAYVNLLLDPKHYQTAIDEMEQLPETFRQTSQRMGGSTPLGDRPLVVLTAGQQPAPGSTPFNVTNIPVDERQVDFQSGMLWLSTNGQQRVVPTSGHLMHLDAPGEVVQAILDVAQMVIDLR